MAISFVDSYNSGHIGAGTAITMTIPAGAQADDLLIAYCHQSQNTDAGVWDDDGGGGNGWTQLAYNRTTGGRDLETAIYYKVHSGTESNPTFTHGTSSPMSGSMLVYRGVDTTTPIDTHAYANAQNDGNPPNPSVTVGNDNSTVICFHSQTHDDVTGPAAPTGFTMRVNGWIDAVADHMNHYSADITGIDTGAYNPPDWQHTVANTTPEYHTYTVVLNEDGSGGGGGTTVDVYNFGFESATGWTLDNGANWQIGTPSQVSARTGSQVLATNLTANYPDNVTTVSYATSPTIDCTSYTDVTLKFWRNLEVEDSSYDQATVQVYNGSSWQTIFTNPSGSNLTDSGWTEMSYDISAHADGISNVQVRFGLASDSSVNFRGWFIDDFLIEGTSTGPLPPSIDDADDEKFLIGETNISITGSSFEASQGTGKLELADSDTYATATKVTQSIDSWSDTSIQFDLTIGSLTDETLWLYVTNNEGDTSSGYQVTVAGTPTISDIEDEEFAYGETGIVLDGSNFQSSQGGGRVAISDNATYGSGTVVNQSIVSWSSTQIEFDLLLTGITATSLYIFVINDVGGVSSATIVTVFIPPSVDSVANTGTISNVSEDVSIIGTNFGATQGSGKVYISTDDTYGSGIMTEQNIVSWSDTEIIFDVVDTDLGFGTYYLYVVNNNGQESSVFNVTIVREPITDGFWKTSNIQQVVTRTGLSSVVFLIRDE